MIPLGRHATPDEVARVVLFLAGGTAVRHGCDAGRRRWDERLGVRVP